MRHRAEQNRLIFAAASAFVWAAGVGFVASYALNLPPYVSAGLALVVGVGTFVTLNRPPVTKR